MSHVDSAFQIAVWPTWIGKQVGKVSRKPFKSKEKLNTVKGLTVHPVTGHAAFTFVEDESVVECFRTLLMTGKLSWKTAPSWALGVAVKCYGDDIGEWCWIAGRGAQGFTCFEIRPEEHLDSADDDVRHIIMTNLLQVAANKHAYRQAQSARDSARYQASLLPPAA